jgi:hypothetical protein
MEESSEDEMKERKRIEALIADMVRERLELTCQDGICARRHETLDLQYSKSEITSDSEDRDIEPPKNRSKRKISSSKQNSNRRNGSSPPG